MIAKILCLTASGLASCYSHLPPPSSTDDRKTDKITDERHMRKLGGANVVTTAAAFLTLLQTTTYIYLMTYSKSSFLPAIQQLSEFERWHAVAAAVTVAGFALRKWSFVTLDKFFTSGIPVLSSLAALSPFALSNYARESPAILGIDVGTWAAVLLVVMHIRMLVRRVDAEEKMLKEHFGREWELFASTRWSGIAHAYAAMPPSASKGAQKADKITDEYWLKKLGMAYTAPAMFATLHILQTVAYILLMTTASETNTLPAVQQLADFKSWHIMATFFSIVGFALRKIHGHGAELPWSAYFALPPRDGSLYVTYIAKWTYQVSESGIPVLSSLAALSPLAVSTYARVNPTFLGVGPGMWIAIIWATGSIRMLMRRMEAEEKMLRQHFGREWDDYAGKRWRLIPFVY
ncbi:hypothetical protein BGZ74_004160 [Mortierella antarctica]|nr:hypothetical protein BGZ74_004160 [Mortierella antarctica]